MLDLRPLSLESPSLVNSLLTADQRVPHISLVIREMWETRISFGSLWRAKNCGLAAVVRRNPKADSSALESLEHLRKCLGAAGELPGFCIHLYLLPCFDKERNANFHARLEFGRFGHAAARRIAPDPRFGIGDGQFHLGR